MPTKLVEPLGLVILLPKFAFFPLAPDADVGPVELGGFIVPLVPLFVFVVALELELESGVFSNVPRERDGFSSNGL